MIKIIQVSDELGYNETGRRLLEAGVEAGLLAARENVRAWGTDPDVAPYARRLATLTGEEEGI